MANPELTEEQKRQQFEAACKAKPLKDQLPSLRSIEGFPIGTDEDILTLSDPPYYTACPNPYINDFIEAFGKPYDPATDDYERTPFVSDISEGKGDPIYNAHSYHTKVPYKAIIPFIEHYTKEGDIVLDGFCGTGMTGVATGILNRKAIISDLSPIATFIASNYNKSTISTEFKKKAFEILEKFDTECKWMYETIHSDGRTKGSINYTVWSDLFICPFCKNDYVFLNVAMESNGKMKKDFNCPHCKANISKNQCERATEKYYDDIIGETVIRTKQVPVIINYSIGKQKYEKKVDSSDIELINRIEKNAIPYWFPKKQMMNKGVQWGDSWRAGYHLGISYIHHFYTKRNLWALATLWKLVHETESSQSQLLFTFEQAITGMSKLARYVPTHYSQVNQFLSGTMYIGSQIVEVSPRYILDNKIKNVVKAFELCSSSKKVIVSTASSVNLQIKPNSIDYIFVDPPFGDNLMYSELNFILEGWHGVLTNVQTEAIINNSQNKDLLEYKNLMLNCFKEMHRILKPNRWITIEFHNSRASIWNAIQDALTKSGFIIAQVSILDKQQGSFKQITCPGAVENDLIINAYKPRQSFEERFLKRAGLDLEKDFIGEHLSHLPKEPNIERTEQMLFSKMLANYIQHGYEIRLNARHFYSLLRDHFKLIDGYWFLDNEVVKYEEWKKANGLQAIEAIAKGQQTLFVTDERSFLIWLYNYLVIPKSYSEIFTASRNILSSSSKIEDQIPEPKLLLDTNFIFQDGKYRRPTTESEREGIESRRERELQKAFEKILEQSHTGTKKIKDVRKEAVAYGFTKAYQEKRFADIVAVAKKIDKEILENNSEINDFVEIAELKVGTF